MTRPHHRLTSLVGAIACALTCLPTFAAKPGTLPSAASQEIANLLGDPMSPVNPYNSGTDPLTMPGDARMAVFPYSRDQIFKVMTAPLKTTTIELAPGESLVADPALGDSIQWVVDTDGANHVFVKPTKPGLVNTMHLTTNQREYDMTLVSSPLGGLFYQTVRFTGNVGAYMRNVSEDLGLDWSFDGSTINVSRFVTRMFQIAAIPGKVSIKSTMSKGMDTSTGNQSNGSGGSSGGNTGSFSAVTSTGRDGEFDQMALISDELNKLKSPMGNITVNPQSRLVMVYDTKDAADRMGRLLTKENAISTRQVAIRVRTLQIALNRGSQAGLNADVVFNSIQGGLAKYAISFVSPTSLSSGGGSVGLSVLRPNAPLSGTNAVINALNSYGRTVQDNTLTKLTLNGLPVSVASFHSDDYLRSTQASSGSLTGTSGGVPGLTPGTVTTGDFVNVLPSVNDHNQIILAYWSDSSKLNGPFTSASVGSGQTQQQIQLAHTTGSKDDQTVALADGQTVVLYGAITDQADSTTNGGIAGITGTWNKSRTFQVIMLTATVVPSM